jgi:uncharacterized protein
MWATDYPHQDGFFPARRRCSATGSGPLSPEAKHQVMAGGAMSFYALR